MADMAGILTPTQKEPFTTPSPGLRRVTDPAAVRRQIETWRAEGRDGMGIPAGTSVRIVEVKGTRVVVEPSVGSIIG